MSVKGIWEEKLPILQFPQKVALKKLIKNMCLWLGQYTTLKVKEGRRRRKSRRKKRRRRWRRERKR